MSTATETIEGLVQQEYKYGFYTDVETDSAPPGLNEGVIRMISAKKKEPEWLTEWRLKAFRHWQTMKEPTWQFVKYPPVNFQDITYYSAPKQKTDGPKSLDDVDPKLLETYEKLGIPLRERGRLAGVAVDAVFDSVSVGTTYRETLAKQGIIFCSMSEAVQEHPELVRKYLGSVVPYTDNYYATLNSAVFTDGIHSATSRKACVVCWNCLHLLPHQCGKVRPVRAHAYHCGRKLLRELSRRLYRTDA